MTEANEGEITPQTSIIPANTNTNEVLVSKEHLQQLIAINQEYQADLIALVSVFSGFAKALNGKSGLGTIVNLVTKIMKDPQQLNAVGNIVPIIEKYTNHAEITE